MEEHAAAAATATDSDAGTAMLTSTARRALAILNERHCGYPQLTRKRACVAFAHALERPPPLGASCPSLP